MFSSPTSGRPGVNDELGSLPTTFPLEAAVRLAVKEGWKAEAEANTSAGGQEMEGKKQRK